MAVSSIRLLPERNSSRPRLSPHPVSSGVFGRNRTHVRTHNGVNLGESGDFCTTVSGLFRGFVCAFAKLRRAAIRFVLSLPSSVCPHGKKNSAPTGRILMKFGFWVFFFFENLSTKIKLGYNLTSIAGTVHEDVLYVCDNISLSSAKNEKCFERVCRGDQNTHFVFRCKRSLNLRGSRNVVQNYRTSFSPTVPPFAARISRVVADIQTPGSESGNV